MTVNKKLQIKFTLITMLAVTIIIIGVFCVVTFENYEMTNTQLDAILNFISENDGLIPDDFKVDEYEGLANEVKYSTRYFTIKVDSKGRIRDVNLEHIASVSHQEAKDITTEVLRNSKNIGFFHNLANSVLENNKIYGFFSNYKYKITDINKEKLIVFVDCQMQLQSFKVATLRSLAVTGSLLVSILVILALASKNILNPIFKSLESQKQFVTNASHEFKTPLAVVMADIDVLEMTVGEDNEWLQSIKNQTKRLDTLTKTLLTLANVQDGKASLQTSKFSINEVIDEVIDEIKILMGNRKITFEKKLDIIINADKNMIKQLINILFDNAIKYTEDDGEIVIKTLKKGRFAKFEIANTCENVKDINIRKVFDRFYRGDPSRSKKEGYGIGLSIAQSIVEIHKGKITTGISKNGMIYFRVFFKI